MSKTEPRPDDEPLAAAMADVRMVTLMQEDLTKYAQRPGLPPEDAQAVEAASGRLLHHLRNTDQWIDRYVAANGVPDRKYLLDAEPKPYPQQGNLPEKLVWFAAETLRLAENIDRRLGSYRIARAEQALRVSADKGNDPARLTRAGAQILGRDPDLQRLLREGRLPATRMLLTTATEQQRAGKLQKPPPAESSKRARTEDVAAAARSTSSKRRKVAAKPDRAEESTDGVSLAVAAAWAMPGEGRHLEHGKTVTEDRTLGLLNDATVGLGNLKAALLHNPWTEEAARAGRTSTEPPVRPAHLTTPAVSRSASPAPR